MKNDFVVQIVHKALESGLLQTSDVEEIEGRGQKEKTVILLQNWKKTQLDELVRRGRIKQEEIEQLYQEVKDADTILSVDNSSEQKPVTNNTFDLEKLKQDKTDTKEVEEDIKEELHHNFPVKNWDRFEFKKLLGYGGMGLVYQAWDVKLNRMVALKFLRNSYSQSSKRFLQEARAQCRIEHDNVCKVYEVGEVNSIPYIVMQYIEGKSLRFAYKEMSLEQKVQVMRDIAYAIHAAHRLGIIHRDIKPDNIMTTKNDDGSYHPMVMDFGLAKELGNKGLTATGEIMGTPGYMSPEQARGQTQLIDRRTDVYSLGAMFYAILVGKAPFQGSSPLEVVLKVINEDPPSVSKLMVSIPADLNTIVMKCLEKDPKQRYESAQLLAQDLQRYLDGETISIKAVSWYYILLRKARKHKALVALSSVTFLLVVSLGIVSIWTRWELSRKIELERQMAEQAEKIEAIMRFVSLTPAHNIIAEQQMAQHELELIKRRMAENGSLAEGPGNYVLGRSYLAFFDYEKARQSLEKAYATGFRTPGLEFALGQVLGEFYHRELDSVLQIEDKEVREAQLEKLEQEYLRPIQGHLGAYLNAKSERSTQETAYLEGLLALYSKDYNLALTKAHQAMGQSSWFYEAYCLEGEIYLTWGEEKSTSSDYKEATDLFLKAEDAFQSASKLGPSNLQARLGLARGRLAVLEMNVYRNESIQEAFEKTLEATDLILQLDPNNTQAFLIKTCSYGRLGEFQARIGQDPNPTMQQAINWNKKASAINPQEIKVYKYLGSIYRVLGRYALDHGQDPQTFLDLAIANLEQVIKLNANYAGTYTTLGLIYRSKGQYSQKHGEDPRHFYDLAAINFQKATQINPTSANAASNLGHLYRNSGEYENDYGRDPSHFYDLAKNSLQKAIQLSPNNPYGHTNLASLYQTQAEYKMQHGQNPEALIKEAKALLEKALELNPKYAFAYTNFGVLYQTRAEYEIEHGQDPQPSLEEASKYFQKLIKINPKHISASYRLGMIYQIRAEYEIEHGQDPTDSFKQAISYLQDAIEINPDNSEVYNSLGFVLYCKMDYEIRCGRAPKELFNNALTNYQKSIEINPEQFAAPFYIALLFCRQSEWQLSNAQNPKDNIEQSRIWLEKAIKIKPDFEWSYRTQAKIELIAARLAIKEQQSPEAFFVKAETAIKKAIEIKADNAKAYLQASQLALFQAQLAINKQQDSQLATALEMAEKSLAIKPNNAESYAIKGATFLTQAKVTNNPATARQGTEMLEKAIQLNQWLKYEYGELLNKSK